MNPLGGTKIPSFTILPEVGFIMIQMRAGITVLEMDFTTNLRMEITSYKIPIRVINLKSKAKMHLLCVELPCASKTMVTTTIRIKVKLIKQIFGSSLLVRCQKILLHHQNASNAADEHLLPEEINESDTSLLSADGNNVLHEQGDSEWNLDYCAATDSSASVSYEGASWDEENWRAQYGQVVQQETECSPGFQVIEMWDSSMVKEIQEGGNYEVAKIVGRLVQPSCKLHPSMPSGGGRLRTAPICKTYLDLVQVRSGQVYKLRSPNAGYLVTLSSYDASNPTKDWGFPELSVERANESCVPKTALQVVTQKTTCLNPNKSSAYEKEKTNTYRDRAAERRALHGGFGVAPGQKRSADDASPPSPRVSVCTEEAAAEALEMSFGAGSYARKILENMGWKEGEALGRTQQGLTEPLQGVGNKDTAGLGWESRGRK